MTEKQPRGTSRLTPEAVLRDARHRRSTAADRIADLQRYAEQSIRTGDAKRLRERLARVPEGERDECAKMLEAIGIAVPAASVEDVQFKDPAVDEANPAPDDADPDDVPEKPPLEEYGEALPRGAQPYVPSETAKAARGRR